MRRNFSIFGKDEAKDIFEEISQDTIQSSILDSLLVAVEASLKKSILSTPFYDSKKGVLLLGKMPTVSFRLETVGLFLEHFGASLETPVLQQDLTALGFQIGASFGCDLINLFENKKWLPKDYEALLEFWSLFDTIAGWGTIRIASFRTDRVIIRMDNSFLSSIGGEHSHRYCDLMTGYITGFLWEAFSQWAYMFDRSDLKARRVFPKIVIHNNKKETCEFAAELVEPELIDCRDHLTAALIKMKRGDIDLASQFARKTLECAFIKKVHISLEHYVKFYSLVQAYKKNVVPLSRYAYDKCGAAYHAFSEKIHPGRKERKDIPRRIADVGYILYELEKVEISPNIETRINNTMKKLQT